MQVPHELPPQQEIDRWIGEPVKALALPASVFSRNRKGFPVLPKAHQELVSHFLQLGVQVGWASCFRRGHGNMIEHR